MTTTRTPDRLPAVADSLRPPRAAGSARYSPEDLTDARQVFAGGHWYWVDVVAAQLQVHRLWVGPTTLWHGAVEAWR